MYKYILILFLSLISCEGSYKDNSREWMQPNGKLKVLCTVEMISDIVKQIGGNDVDVYTLIQGELDPHSYQLVKGDDEKLKFANIIFFNGLNLEHGPSLKGFLDTSRKAVGLGNMILKEYPALILRYNGKLDPHIWMDVSLWVKTIPYIVNALIENDPIHKKEYEERGKKVEAELMGVHVKIKEELHQIPENRRYLVTSHDAFNYFTRAYLAEDGEKNWQKRFAAPEGLAPESQLSTTDIQGIIDHMKKYHIQILFPESNVSQDSIRKILDAGSEHGMHLIIASPFLYGDAMGKPGSSGDSYIKMMQYDAIMIKKHLKDIDENRE